MRIRVLLLVFLAISIQIFAVSPESILTLSKDPLTLEKAQDEVLNALIDNPASLTLLNTARTVYSKIEIVKSTQSTPETALANTIIEENRDLFYKTLSDPALTTLPSTFDLLFNILPISQDYDRFFTYISQGDYDDALTLFKKLKYIYKIPDSKAYLPKENVVSLWNFFAQEINIDPSLFDTDAAQFVTSIANYYDIKNIYVKTYIWLSGLSIPQSQMGFNVINFESLIASTSNVQMDPNLLQWKFTVSNYLALYSSISDAIREFPSAKDTKAFITNSVIFYRAAQNLPHQYSTSISGLLSTYLNLIFNAVSANPTLLSTDTANEMRKIASEFISDPNSSKLLAIALTVQKTQSKSSAAQTGSIIYSIIVIAIVIFLLTIPQIRLMLYKILKFHGMELKFYTKRIARKPQDPQIHMKIADIYERMGRYDEAKREYSVAIKLTDVKKGDNR